MPNVFSGRGGVGLYNFEDGALTADSVGENTLTANGSPASDQVLYKQGAASANLVRASNQFFNITDANLPAGHTFKSNGTQSGDKFTVCFWHYVDDLSALYTHFGKWAASAGNYALRCYSAITTGAITIEYSYDGSAGPYTIAHASSLQVGRWYHVAIIYGTLGLTIRIWDDTAGAILGTDITNQGLTGTSWYGNSTADFCIGAAYATASLADGRYDELVILDRVLSKNAVDDIRAGTFDNTAGNDFSTDTDCMAVLNFEPSYDDFLIEEIENGTINKSASISWDETNKKQGYGSAEWQSTDSGTVTQPQADMQTGHPFKIGSTGAWSICGWIRPNTTGNWNILCSQANGVQANKASFYVRYDNNDKLILGISYNGTNWTTLLSHASALTVNQWYHVGITFDYAGGEARIRIWDDTAGAILGTDITAVPTADMARPSLAEGLIIGLWAGYADYWDGNIDEFVVFKRALSNSDIDKIRAGSFGKETTITILDEMEGFVSLIQQTTLISVLDTIEGATLDLTDGIILTIRDDIEGVTEYIPPQTLTITVYDYMSGEDSEQKQFAVNDYGSFVEEVITGLLGENVISDGGSFIEEVFVTVSATVADIIEGSEVVNNAINLVTVVDDVEGLEDNIPDISIRTIFGEVKICLTELAPSIEIETMAPFIEFEEVDVPDIETEKRRNDQCQ